MIFWKLSQLIFIEKPMKNHDLWILGIPKNAKTLFFPWFFAKNGNFDESASWWSEKKILPSGSGGPKNEFKALLWYDAIKICHRLIRFLHFWWFDFLIFWCVPAHFWWKTIEKSWFFDFCGDEKCKNRNFRLDFM